MKKTSSGFTIVELLIVIVVIGILAAITIVAYNGIQNRAKNIAVQGDISQAQKLVEAYNGLTGSYPTTGGLTVVYADNNCQLTTINKRADWIPNLTGISGSLPQNPGLTGTGVGGAGGCYMYASDGQRYIISAWNAKRGGPDKDTMYRRMGFREPSWFHENTYYCNHAYIGGTTSGTYILNTDFYKYSYTVSNITSTTCNETPPAGA